MGRFAGKRRDGGRGHQRRVAPRIEAMEGRALLATFIINSTGDAPDANPGDGVCATAAGDCTLRAAIMEANATTDTEPVVLDFNIPGDGVQTIRPDSELPE